MAPTPAPARAPPQLPAALLLPPAGAASTRPLAAAPPGPAAARAAAATKPPRASRAAAEKKTSTRDLIAGLKNYYREVDDFVLAEEEGSGEGRNEKGSFPFASSLGGATAGGAAAAAAASGRAAAPLSPWAWREAMTTKNAASKGKPAPSASAVPPALLRRRCGEEGGAAAPDAAAVPPPASSPLGAFSLAATPVTSSASASTPRSGPAPGGGSGGVDSRPWVASAAKRPSPAAAPAAEPSSPYADAAPASPAAETAVMESGAPPAAAAASALTAAATRPRRGGAADFFLTPAAQQQRRGDGAGPYPDAAVAEEGPELASPPSPIIMVEVDDDAEVASPAPAAAAAVSDPRPAFPAEAATEAAAVPGEFRRQQQQQRAPQAGPRLPSTGKRVTRRRGRLAHVAGEEAAAQEEQQAPMSPAPSTLQLQGEGEEEAAAEAEAAAMPSNAATASNPARALGAALARLRLTPSPTGNRGKATASRRNSRLGGSEKEEEAREEEVEGDVASSPTTTTTTTAAPLSPLLRLLRVCGQEQERSKLPSMDSLLARHVCLAGVAKCGEGTFGEAFRCRGGAVVKVVPFVADDAAAAAILAEAAEKGREWEAAVARGNLSSAPTPEGDDDDDDQDDVIDDGVIKTAAELLAEAEIGLALTSLAAGCVGEEDKEGEEASSSAPPLRDATSGFCATRAVGVCSGPYSATLAAEWESWRRGRGTDNLHPRSRAADRRVLHAVFVADDGGADLEAALSPPPPSPPSPSGEPLLRGLADVVSLLAQVTGALAAAEGALRFEHRDLHWGNVLLRREGGDEGRGGGGAEGRGGEQRGRAGRGAAARARATPPASSRCLLRVGGRAFALREDAAGLRVRLIDFTLSRCDSEGAAAGTAAPAAAARGPKQQPRQPPPAASYCDLSSDPLLFRGPRGDPQSETYRAMAKVSRGDWQAFHPSTNALWISYLSGVLLGSVAVSGAAADGGGGDAVRLLRGFKRRAAAGSSARALLEDEIFKGVWEEVTER